MRKIKQIFPSGQLFGVENMLYLYAMNDFEHNKKRALTLAALGAIGLVLLFVLKPDKEEWHKPAGIVWNTEYHITYLSAADLSDSIDATFRRVELSVSPFNKASLITAINEGRTDRLDAALTAIYTKSVEINKDSGGAFDPTLSPLINAWGFGFKSGNMPSDAQIDSMLQFVGIGKTRLNGNRLIKADPRTTFNFSAIAKGYGCDEIGRMLERNGVTDYLVEVGGEIVAKGKNPQGEKWHVSIDKPIISDGIIHESADVVAVTGCAIATSGNYRNFKTDSLGNHYAHIISPSSGRPSTTDILSATVIAPDCMTADAYATTLMVLGMEKSRQLLSRHPELSAMLITSDGGKFKIWHTGNFPK